MLSLIVALWRKHFGVHPPDPREIEAKYADHDRKIAEIEGTTRKVRTWRMRLAADGQSGNILRDMVTGDYKPQRHGSEPTP